MKSFVKLAKLRKMAASFEQNTTKINGLKPKPDMQMMYCSVCKIFLNSQSQADAHYAGKSHKNKAKSLSSEATTLAEGSAPKETLTMVQITKNSQFYKCDVCQKYFNSSLQLQDHMHGKAHQQMAQTMLENSPGISGSLNAGIISPGTLNTGTLNPGNVIPGSSNPGTLNPGNLIPGSSNPGALNPGTLNPEMLNPGNLIPGTLNPGALSPGTVSPKTGSSNGLKIKLVKPVIQHSTSQPSEPVKPVTNVGKNLSDLFHCERCNITLNSKKQLEQHNKGLRHKIIIGKAKPPAVSGEKWENVRYMKISNAILGINKDTATGSGGGMNLREYRCEKCDITVNSQTQLDQHLQSNKHKMKDVKPPNNGQNKRKRPPTGHGGIQNPQQNNKRPYQGPGPLAKNFVHSNTYIPAGGGIPQYRSPHIAKQYHPQNPWSQNWKNTSFGYDTNVVMF